MQLLSLSRLLALIALVIIGVTACGKSETPSGEDAAAPADKWSKLRIGIDPTYKPFTYKTPEGEPTGFDVDVAKLLCEELNASCTFVDQVWDGMIPGLNAKKYDAIVSSMSITAERQKVVNFTGKYYNTPSCVVTKGTAGENGSNYAAYSGMNIGVLKGSTQENFAMGELEPKGVTLASYDGQDQVYLDIKSGRLDGTVADVIEVQGGFLDTPDGKGYTCTSETLGAYVQYFGEGLGIALRKEDTDLLQKLNAGIETIRNNGKWQQASDKYFPGVDIWGD